MKKLNQGGFTLIELLAVITIMGILMMVAIPSVSRVIENSRRDAFANTANEYIKQVRNAVTADSISCDTKGDLTKQVVASATPRGTYYFVIATTESTGIYDSTAESNTTDLMESGGKSPFGSAELYGYVKWVKEEDDTTGKVTSKYTIILADSGEHGFKSELAESQIRRSNVSTAGADIPAEPEGVRCYLN